MKAFFKRLNRDAQQTAIDNQVNYNFAADTIVLAIAAIFAIVGSYYWLGWRGLIVLVVGMCIGAGLDYEDP